MKVIIKNNSMNPMGWNVGDLVELSDETAQKYIAEGKVEKYQEPLTLEEQKKQWLEELVAAGAVKLTEEKKEETEVLTVKKKKGVK